VAVDVPVDARPDRFVIARVGGLEPSALGQLAEALTKAPDWYATLDGTRYRLVPGTAADGLLLAVPAAADGTAPFAFGRPIRTIAIAAGPHGRDSAAMLTYEFFSVPLAGP
jgi:adenine/guanine phosphoribosyltransferase-like PRPP-binding protein